MTRDEAKAVLLRKGAIHTKPDATSHEFSVMYCGYEYQACHWWPSRTSDLGNMELEFWDATVDGLENVLGWCEESIVPWEFWEERVDG